MQMSAGAVAKKVALSYNKTKQLPTVLHYWRRGSKQ